MSMLRRLRSPQWEEGSEEDDGEKPNPEEVLSSLRAVWQTSPTPQQAGAFKSETPATPQPEKDAPPAQAAKEGSPARSSKTIQPSVPSSPTEKDNATQATIGQPEPTQLLRADAEPEAAPQPMEIPPTLSSTLQPTCVEPQFGTAERAACAPPEPADLACPAHPPEANVPSNLLSSTLAPPEPADPAPSPKAPELLSEDREPAQTPQSAKGAPKSADTLRPMSTSPLRKTAKEEPGTPPGTQSPGIDGHGQPLSPKEDQPAPEPADMLPQAGTPEPRSTCANTVDSSSTPKRAKDDSPEPEEETPKRMKLMAAHVRDKWQSHVDHLLATHSTNYILAAPLDFDETVEWVRDIARGKVETADKKGSAWVELQKRQVKGTGHANIDVCLKLRGEGFNAQVLSARVTDHEKLFMLSMGIRAIAMVAQECTFFELRDDRHELLLPLLPLALELEKE